MPWRVPHRSLPWPLPGGQALLYTVRKRQLSWGDEEVVAQTLATGTRKVLLKDAADARYVPTGHLVFLRRGALFTVPFDAGRLEVHGTPVPLMDTVAQALTAANPFDVTGAGQFAIAATGTLAWVPAPVVPWPRPRWSRWTGAGTSRHCQRRPCGATGPRCASPPNPAFGGVHHDPH